jgi:hypothetical protein
MDAITKTMWTRRRIDPVTALLTLVTLAALAGAGWLRLQSRLRVVPLAVDALAPPLRLLDVDTSEPLVLLGSSGKVTWLTFWSADSATAQSDLKLLERASNRLKAHRRFALLAAAVEPDQGKTGRVRAFLQANGLDLPAYLVTPETLRHFGVTSADPPFHVLIGADGRVFALAQGCGRSTIQRIVSLVQQHLDELDPHGATRFAAVKSPRMGAAFCSPVFGFSPGPTFASQASYVARRRAR